MTDDSRLTYRDSGVDIDNANEATDRIKDLAKSTFTQSVISEIGAFAGLYRPDFKNIQIPLLVSSADGVGTKLKVAFLTGIHNTVGIDLVAHCTNDILVQRALPLFFLDYIGTGKLDPKIIEQIVKGLAKGCTESGCSLLGGETAEMPGFYQDGEYDLAGFIVGMTDELKLRESGPVNEDDILIGLPSSGLHTNGYSLVRRLVFDEEKLKVDTHIDELGQTIGEELLIPHRNYLPIVKELLLSDDLSGLAHITGGGITENLARILPNNFDAEITRGTWEILPIFDLIRDRGQVETSEMYRTFNMGIGMVLVVNSRRIERVRDFLSAREEQFRLIGKIVPGTGKVRYV